MATGRGRSVPIPCAYPTSHGHLNAVAAHSFPVVTQGGSLFPHGCPCDCSLPKVTRSLRQLTWKPISLWPTILHGASCGSNKGQVTVWFPMATSSPRSLTPMAIYYSHGNSSTAHTPWSPHSHGHCQAQSTRPALPSPWAATPVCRTARLHLTNNRDTEFCPCHSSNSLNLESNKELSVVFTVVRIGLLSLGMEKHMSQLCLESVL